MRAWMDESPHIGPQVLPYNSYNADMDLEEVLRVDPAETLPSPVGTPVPLDYMEALAQPSSGSISPSCVSTDETLVPREPTTVILKLIDEVCHLSLQGLVIVNDNCFDSGRLCIC